MSIHQQVDLDSVWRSLHADLRTFLARRLPSESLADDLLQETFLKLHRNADKLRDVERIDAWVYRIARNLVIDFYRTKDSNAGPLYVDTDSLVSGEKEPVTNQNRRIGKWLVAAIDQLPEKYREPVRMYEIESKSQQAIADQLQLTLSATKSRIQRGREKLRELVEQCCALEIDSRGNVIDYTRNSDEAKPDCCR